MKNFLTNRFVLALFWLLSIGATISICLINAMFSFWLMSSFAMELVARIWYFLSLFVFFFCVLYWLGKIILFFRLPKEEKKQRRVCIAVAGVFLALMVVQFNCDRWVRAAYPENGTGACVVVEKGQRKDFYVKVKVEKTGAVVTLYTTKKEHQLLREGQEFAAIDYISLSKEGEVGWIYNYSFPYAPATQ